MIQFAILGPLGEYIATKIKKRQWNYGIKETILKGIGWALLAVLIKYVFVGFVGFIDELVKHKPHAMLPLFFEKKENTEAFFMFARVPNAFARSFVTNLLFAPQLFFLHRAWDNLIDKKNDYAGLPKAMLTIFWFWIPAHTLTFCLRPEYQMGLAAFWSLALGIILGYFITAKKK